MISRASCIVALLLSLPACSRTPTEASDPPQPAPPAQHATASFVFHYQPLDAAIVPAVAEAVEQASRRIVSELRADGMPRVQVHFYESHAAMAEAVRAVVPSLPPWASGLVTAPDRIHLISPSRAGDGIDRAAVRVAHEFAHCVTLHIDAQSGNNPRWLWETIAIYEARQRVDLRTIPYLVAGQPPSLTELNSTSNTLVYDVGYSIGEFIVARGGADALRSLVLARGDTSSVLGLSADSFINEWFQFARSRDLAER